MGGEERGGIGVMECALGLFFASSVAGWLLAYHWRVKSLKHEHQISDMGHSIQAANGLIQHQHGIIMSLQRDLAECEDGEGWKHGSN